MKVHIPKEWLMSKAHLEEGLETGAGRPGFMSTPKRNKAMPKDDLLRQCIIRLEAENAALKADRDMLDWFEKHVSAVSMRTVYFSFPGGRTLREAISDAMKEPDIK